MRKTGSLNGIALGAVSGLAGTAIMSIVMVGSKRLGVMGRLPPHEITSDALARGNLDDRVSPRARRALGWLNHFGFGAAAGAAFASLDRGLVVRAPRPARAVGFATLVWLVSYMGWIPALGLLPAATDDQPGRPLTMIGAHLVFGLVLVAAADPRPR